MTSAAKPSSPPHDKQEIEAAMQGHKIDASTMLARTAACAVTRRCLATNCRSSVRYGCSQSIRCLSVGISAPQSPPCATNLNSPIDSSPPPTRFFSSRPQQQRKNKRKNNGVVVNEDLIQILMRRYDAAAGDLLVRLVVDEGPSQPSSIQVVSLLKAMETARDLDVDLVGINLNQDPPVVKAQDYGKLAYKAASKKQTKSDKKPTKEFKLRSGIADNDLDRKVKDVVRYLRKGHNCQLSITANGFNMRTNPQGLEHLVDKVLDQVGEAGVCDRGVQSSEEGNRAFFLLRPNTGRS